MARSHKENVASNRNEEIQLRELVAQLIETWSSAWSSKDTASASRFYSKEPDLVFFDIGPVHIGWDQYRRNIEESFNEIESLSLALNDDLRVMIRDGLALTTATGHLSVRGKEGKSSDSDFRFTGVWDKKEDVWQLVHDHWSAHPSRDR